MAIDWTGYRCSTTTPLDRINNGDPGNYITFSTPIEENEDNFDILKVVCDDLAASSGGAARTKFRFFPGVILANTVIDIAALFPGTTWDASATGQNADIFLNGLMGAIGDPLSGSWQYCECDALGVYKNSGAVEHIKFSVPMNASDYIIMVVYS